MLKINSYFKILFADLSEVWGLNCWRLYIQSNNFTMQA